MEVVEVESGITKSMIVIAGTTGITSGGDRSG